MIPIAKNIMVLDDAGNQYEATYPKRAKGLVKAGRARFVDESTICLVRPPTDRLEDNRMENLEKIMLDMDTEKQELSALTVQTVVADAEPALAEKEESTRKQLIASILKRIDAILEDTSYIHECVAQISNSPNGMSGNGAIGLGNLVEAREKTNQAILCLLGNMYHDLKAECRN